jgi:hypothetical protein
MQPSGESIDWSGVQPGQSAIEPLNDRSFSFRLRRLSQWAKDLTILRNAAAQPHSNGQQFSRAPESTPR